MDEELDVDLLVIQSTAVTLVAGKQARTSVPYWVKVVLQQYSCIVSIVAPPRLRRRAIFLNIINYFPVHILPFRFIFGTKHIMSAERLGMYRWIVAA
jgi:hypothetical protein